MDDLNLCWTNLKERINQVAVQKEKLEQAGFAVRGVNMQPTHFLISTDHGGEGATSRWSSSWVRRYTYDG